uniref:Large ribosomal subunit protein uL23c n=1 Tax=Euglena hiemalis TaxID=392896 RepID=A0A345UC51_9EUGL|nr:ribosomal protein L23 [Euglena hiemalis]AXI98037.1 ribosomal protein L23 [Euglena hiemalis]
MVDLSFLKFQILTDKTNKLLKNNVYVFDVDKKILKRQIKNLVQNAFEVKVVSVNSYVKSSKVRRLNNFEGFKNHYKRTFITLFAGNKIIPFFSSL